MHELSILKEIIRIVEVTVAKQKITKVNCIVLQVGELCSIVPEYIEELYPIATFRTSLEEAKLEVQIIPGYARCIDCGKVFNVVENEGKCPDCKGSAYDIISGRDFLLKEIIAY